MEAEHISRQLVEALLRDTRDGIIVENGDSQIAIVNQRLCNLLGIEESPESLTGKDHVASLESF